MLFPRVSASIYDKVPVSVPQSGMDAGSVEKNRVHGLALSADCPLGNAGAWNVTLAVRVTAAHPIWIREPRDPKQSVAVVSEGGSRVDTVRPADRPGRGCPFRRALPRWRVREVER